MTLFTSAGFHLSKTQGQGLPSGPDFVRLLGPLPTDVLELQVAKTAYQHLIIQRAILTPHAVKVATPEDLVVLKLLASRPKDMVDLHQLVRLPALDLRYVEVHAQEWGVEALLEALLKSAQTRDTP